MNFDESKKRLLELYNERFKDVNSKNENYKIFEVEFNEVFSNLLKTSISEEKFFSGSPLKLFIIELENQLKIEEIGAIDFDEIEYIKNKYLHFCKLLESHQYHKKEDNYYYISSLNNENYKLFRSIIIKRTEFMEKLLFKKGIEIITTKPYGDLPRVNRVFKKHINIMVENDNLKPIKLTTENTLKWNGTQTEFIELVKALIENGNIKGTQTEIISKLSTVFNIEIKNPNKLINDLKLRNNDSETLFLDRLQKSLFDYITLEKKK